MADEKQSNGNEPHDEADLFVLVFGHGKDYSVASNSPPHYTMGMLCGAIVQLTTNAGWGLDAIEAAVNVAWSAHKEKTP